MKINIRGFRFWLQAILRVCLLSGVLFLLFLGPSFLEAADYPHTKLSGAMAAGGSAIQMQLSPNGNYLVFRADKDTQGVVERYSVNLGTREVIKLNGDLLAGRISSTSPSAPPATG